MNLRRAKPVLRIQFLGLCMLIGLSALLARLWWVQVARGKEWTARIQGSSEATVRIPSIRGEIRDRNGVTLVQNRASYEVDFYLPRWSKATGNATVARLRRSTARRSVACQRT